jgi:copper resistance protein C
MKIGKAVRHAVVAAGTVAWMVLASSQACAHAKLLSVVPAADSTVAPPNVIQVHFNEAVETKLSKIKVTASDGAVVAAVNVNQATDPSTLSIMPSRPLKAGVYTVSWSVVTDDGHKESGSFKFTVK